MERPRGCALGRRGGARRFEWPRVRRSFSLPNTARGATCGGFLAGRGAVFQLPRQVPRARKVRHRPNLNRIADGHPRDLSAASPALPRRLPQRPWPATRGPWAPGHGIAMHGEPALPEGFLTFPTPIRHRPRGGRVAALVSRYLRQLQPPSSSVFCCTPAALRGCRATTRSADRSRSPSYGLIASASRCLRIAARSPSNLDPAARSSDGAPSDGGGMSPSTFQSLKADGVAASMSSSLSRPLQI